MHWIGIKLGMMNAYDTKTMSLLQKFVQFVAFIAIGIELFGYHLLTVSEISFKFGFNSNVFYSADYGPAT